MLKVASQRNGPPYWAVTAGPKSHSPAPTADPATSTPGPISSAQWRRSDAGGGINSPTCQGMMDLAVAVTSPAAGSIDSFVSGAIVQAITPAMALFRAGISSVL